MCLGLGSRWPRHGTLWRCLRGGVVIKAMMVMMGTKFPERRKLDFKSACLLPAEKIWTLNLSALVVHIGKMRR